MSTTAERHEAKDIGPRLCPACGAAARRRTARFCSTCGRGLDEDYFPTDTLRASYRFERRPATHEANEREGARSPAPLRRREVLPARHAARRARSRFESRFESRPARGGDGAATAVAFVTYALVPYLGILFCPGALLLGGIGLLRSRRSHAGRRRTFALAVLLGLIILCVQLLLWWILYKVPEWSSQ